MVEAHVVLSDGHPRESPRLLLTLAALRRGRVVRLCRFWSLAPRPHLRTPPAMSRYSAAAHGLYATG